jgi:hypothetical protein
MQGCGLRRIPIPRTRVNKGWSPAYPRPDWCKGACHHSRRVFVTLPADTWGGVLRRVPESYESFLMYRLGGMGVVYIRNCV